MNWKQIRLRRKCEICGIIVSKHMGKRVSVVYHAFKVYLCATCLNKSNVNL